MVERPCKQKTPHEAHDYCPGPRSIHAFARCPGISSGAIDWDGNLLPPRDRYAKSYLTEPDLPLPRNGVWRRAPMDWAYRIEIAGYGSIAGVGFSTKAEAREAMARAREEALSNE